MSVSFLKISVKSLIFSVIVFVSLILFSSESQAERTKESLEQFDLASLRILGVHKEKCGMHASILDPNGYLHTVRKGNYAGKNSGMIVRISKSKIYVKEVYLAAPGDWQERVVFIEKKR